MNSGIANSSLYTGTTNEEGKIIIDDLKVGKYYILEKEASIKRFLTSLPEKYKVAEGEGIFNACIFEINEDNCRTVKIERINMK